MGAAKMHMFMMSVVGVMMAAIMKITRMEWEVAPHPPGAQYAHQRQEKHQDRHLKDDAHYRGPSLKKSVRSKLHKWFAAITSARTISKSRSKPMYK